MQKRKTSKQQVPTVSFFLPCAESCWKWGKWVSSALGGYVWGESQTREEWGQCSGGRPDGEYSPKMGEDMQDVMNIGYCSDWFCQLCKSVIIHRKLRETVS